MNWFIKERVLHATYSSKTDIPDGLLRLTDAYEGAIPHRVGWNIPFSFLKTTSPAPAPAPALAPFSLTPLWNALRNKEADYLVVYPEKDIQTKKHELLHARYRMDAVYQQEVRDLWASLSDADQKKVHVLLRGLHYPDNPDILLDEFQAYYFTEPPSFFGLTVSRTRQRTRFLSKKKSPTAKRK